MIGNVRIIDWFAIGIGVKRWLVVLLLGIFIVAFGTAYAMLELVGATVMHDLIARGNWLTAIAIIIAGLCFVALAVMKLATNILAPYRRNQRGDVIDVLQYHSKRSKGFKFVAIGGGTGLPATLKGMKAYTNNITAIVTVADDGGSSGKLRRDMGVLPPGDLRNNIAALADDESLLTHLFQYRFEHGDLKGHAFGNLFIAALANIVGDDNDNKNSLAEALVEVARILNIQGRVLPATLDDVTLTATICLKQSNRRIKVKGESQFEKVNGAIEKMQVHPADIEAYPDSVKAIMEADVVVIGPGSLYTSILPNLMVKGIVDALRATSAYKIYVCNVATQPVETEGYTVAEHVMALETHIGRGVFQAVLANDAYPQEKAGITQYVMPSPDNHEILQRYEVRYTDLCDSDRPWRHDPEKLATAILAMSERDQNGLAPFINLAS